LQYTSGVVLSRTFGIKCHKHFDLTRLTKALISKCKEYNRPIFSNIDIDTDFDKKKKFKMDNDVMHNILDGMDGFFIGVNSKLKMIDNLINFQIDILRYFVCLFKRIQVDRNLFTLSIGEKKK
jgi:hypothetical protein